MIVRDVQVDEIQWDLSPAPVSECAGADLVVDVVVEAQSYRLLAQEAIHALHAMQRQYGQIRAAHYELLGERRGLREDAA